jgi:hypothetical protein
VHNNMFQNGHSKKEVRQAYKNDYIRDLRLMNIYDVITVICIGVVAFQQSALIGIAVFVGSNAALVGLRKFIEQSNRNYFLHRLDWEDALKRRDDDL